MYFVIHAIDAKDKDALNRRLVARDGHLENARKLKESGRLLMAAAILSEEDRMIGSNIVCEFGSREELDSWLEAEPYIKAGVWETISIYPCKIAPFCL